MNGLIDPFVPIAEHLTRLGRPIGEMIAMRPLHDAARPGRTDIVSLAVTTDAVDRRHRDMQSGIAQGRMAKRPPPDDPVARMQRECVQSFAAAPDDGCRLAMLTETVLHEPLRRTDMVERNATVDAARALRRAARERLDAASVTWPSGDRAHPALPARLVGAMGDITIEPAHRLPAMVAHAINAGMRGTTICAFRYGSTPVQAALASVAHRFRDECNKAAIKAQREATDLIDLAVADLKAMVGDFGLRGSGALYGMTESEMRKLCMSKGFIPAHATR